METGFSFHSMTQTNAVNRKNPGLNTGLTRLCSPSFGLRLPNLKAKWEPKNCHESFPAPTALPNFEMTDHKIESVKNPTTPSAIET